MLSGFSSALLFSGILILYAAVIWTGGYLRIEKVTEGSGENEKMYSGGQVIAIMFAVIFGAFNLVGAVPHIKALTEGRIAGKIVFDFISTIPKVDPNVRGEPLDVANLSGRIEFRNVSFSYPSRPE